VNGLLASLELSSEKTLEGKNLQGLILSVTPPSERR
jgi:hypothetical protein